MIRLLHFALASSLLVMAIPALAQRQCAADRPCITQVYNEGPNLIIKWTDPNPSNHWNFRWTRDDDEYWHDNDVDRKWFRLKNFRANTNYTFAVQGCRKPPLQRSICSAFEQTTVRSCGAKSKPCR